MLCAVAESTVRLVSAQSHTVRRLLTVTKVGGRLTVTSDGIGNGK